jgi:hypothetical protein
VPGSVQPLRHRVAAITIRQREPNRGAGSSTKHALPSAGAALAGLTVRNFVLIRRPDGPPVVANICIAFLSEAVDETDVVTGVVAY